MSMLSDAGSEATIDSLAQQYRNGDESELGDMVQRALAVVEQNPQPSKQQPQPHQQVQQHFKPAELPCFSYVPPTTTASNNPNIIPLITRVSTTSSKEVGRIVCRVSPND